MDFTVMMPLRGKFVVQKTFYLTLMRKDKMAFKCRNLSSILLACSLKFNQSRWGILKCYDITSSAMTLNFY